MGSCRMANQHRTTGAGRTGHVEHGTRAYSPERPAVLEADGRRGNSLPIGYEPRGGAAHSQPLPVFAGKQYAWMDGWSLASCCADRIADVWTRLYKKKWWRLNLSPPQKKKKKRGREKCMQHRPYGACLIDRSGMVITLACNMHRYLLKEISGLDENIKNA